MEDQHNQISIVITPEQAKKLYQLVPWGVKNRLFCAIIDDLIPLLEKHGPKVIMAILSKDLKIKSYAKSLFEEDKSGNTK